MKTKRIAALLMAGVMVLSQGIVYGEELTGEDVEVLTSGDELPVVGTEVAAVGAEALDSPYSSFVNDSRWSHGVSWGDNQRPKLSSFGSKACCAYCADFTKYCFGIDNPTGGTVFSSGSEVRAGDVIHLSTGHWIAVLKRSGSSLYVAEGNYLSRVNIGWNYSVSGNAINGVGFTGYHFAAPVNQKGTLNVDGVLDGRSVGNTDYYGNFHVYINGQRITTEPVSDFYHTGLNPGDTFEIKDIKADPGKIYIADHSISGTIEANSEKTVYLTFNSAANLGDDFYAVILNTKHWKPISLNPDNHKVTLEKETGAAYQKWRFIRQQNGSYLIKSCFDGKVLEMTDGIRTNGTQLTARGDDWGGMYQRWFIFKSGSDNKYMIRSAHFQEEEWVVDLYNILSANGTPINICKRNNSDGQFFSIYQGNEIQLSGPTLKSSVNNNEVTFEWNKPYGAKSFNLKIWKGTLWEGNAYKIIENATSGITLTLDEGTYNAYVDAEDYFQYKMSNSVEFTIKHNVTPTATPTPKPTATPTPKPTATPTPRPTATPTPRPTAMPTPTPKPTSGWTGKEQIRDLKGSSSTEGAVLTWSAYPGAEGYLIGAIQNGKPYRQIDFIVGGYNTRYVDKNASLTDYSYYWVFPYKKVNGKVIGGSASSNYAYGIKLLPAPQYLHTTGTTRGINLGWGTVSNADGFIVKRRTGSYGAAVVIADVRGTSYTDTSASRTETSYYWVYAYKRSGNTKRPGVVSSYAYGKMR